MPEGGGPFLQLETPAEFEKTFFPTKGTAPSNIVMETFHEYFGDIFNTPFFYLLLVFSFIHFHLKVLYS